MGGDGVQNPVDLARGLRAGVESSYADLRNGIDSGKQQIASPFDQAKSEIDATLARARQPLDTLQTRQAEIRMEKEAAESKVEAARQYLGTKEAAHSAQSSGIVRVMDEAKSFAEERRKGIDERQKAFLAKGDAVKAIQERIGQLAGPGAPTGKEGSERREEL